MRPVYFLQFWKCDKFLLSYLTYEIVFYILLKSPNSIQLYENVTNFHILKI